MVLKKRSITLGFIGSLSLAPLFQVALGKERPPGSVAHEDGKPHPEPVPALPQPPISREQYESSQNLIFTIFGEKARKIFGFYDDLEPFDFSRPGAPDHKIEVVRYEGQLKCVRRMAKLGEEKARCNFLFHPAQGTTLTVGDYTFTLDPVFNGPAVEKFILRLKKDTHLTARILIDETCPRFGQPTISQGSLSCAYFNEQDDIDAFFFPEDYHPQGVAVGWGVVQPETITQR